MKKVFHIAIFALGLGFMSAQISIADKATQVTGQVKTTTDAISAAPATTSVGDLSSKEGVKNAVKAEANKKISELKDKAAAKVNEKVKSSTGLDLVKPSVPATPNSSISVPTPATPAVSMPSATTSKPAVSMPNTTTQKPAVNMPNASIPAVNVSKETAKEALKVKTTELKDKASNKLKEKAGLK